MQVIARFQLASINDVKPTLDIEVVKKGVQGIWGLAGVEFVFSPGKDLKLSFEEINTTSLDVEVANALAPQLAETAEKKLIDIVFVPRYGFWGKGYTSLVPAGAKSTPSFAPFSRPTAIIATEVAKRPSQQEDKRRDMCQAFAENENDALQLAAIINDTAHEIGHLFGLKHTTEVNRPGAGNIPINPRLIHFLMHDTLYNQIWSLQSSNASDPPRDLSGAKDKIAEPSRSHITNIGKNNEWFVALRGAVLAPEDISYIQTQIQNDIIFKENL